MYDLHKNLVITLLFKFYSIHVHVFLTILFYVFKYFT